MKLHYLVCVCVCMHDCWKVSAGGMTQHPGEASQSISEGGHKKIKPFKSFFKI